MLRNKVPFQNTVVRYIATYKKKTMVFMFRTMKCDTCRNAPYILSSSFQPFVTAHSLNHATISSSSNFSGKMFFAIFICRSVGLSHRCAPIVTCRDTTSTHTSFLTIDFYVSVSMSDFLALW